MLADTGRYDLQNVEC